MAKRGKGAEGRTVEQETRLQKNNAIILEDRKLIAEALRNRVG